MSSLENYRQNLTALSMIDGDFANDANRISAERDSVIEQCRTERTRHQRQHGEFTTSVSSQHRSHVSAAKSFGVAPAEGVEAEADDLDLNGARNALTRLQSAHSSLLAAQDVSALKRDDAIVAALLGCGALWMVFAAGRVDHPKHFSIVLGLLICLYAGLNRGYVMFRRERSASPGLRFRFLFWLLAVGMLIASPVAVAYSVISVGSVVLYAIITWIGVKIVQRIFGGLGDFMARATGVGLVTAGLFTLVVNMACYWVWGSLRPEYTSTWLAADRGLYYHYAFQGLIVLLSAWPRQNDDLAF